MTKTVSVLGVTGSVGQSALSVMAHGGFRAGAFTAQENWQGLAQAAIAHRAKLAVIGNPAHYENLKKALAGSGVEPRAGEAEVVEAARFPADVVLCAIVGVAGLQPAWAAVGQGGVVALANKEALVAAGELLMERARSTGANIIPVDSEHSAVFQLFDAAQTKAVTRVVLTASGGPFREWSTEALEKATPEQAVRHPNWSMGAKISVDSATMMNKGLELIEAARLFPVPHDALDVVVHKESIIHGLVEYADGSLLAHLSPPDMRTPIAYALNWPERGRAPVQRLDLPALKSLSFEAPDEARFPALALAKHALKQGGAAPCVLNAANEVAVQAFLDKRIGFTRIAKCVEQVLGSMENNTPATLDDVLALNSEARARAGTFI